MNGNDIIDVEENALELHSRENRKATGRLVAIAVALFLIFLAIYHAWIRKTAVLAGVLVPALIMALYGGWVIFLAKRDKRRRLLMIKEAEEMAMKELHSEREKSKSKESVLDNNTSSSKPSKSAIELHSKRRSNGSKSESDEYSVNSVATKKPPRTNVRYKVLKTTRSAVKHRRRNTPLCRTCSAP